MNIVKSVKSAESTISMFLGILVVIVVGILLFNYFKTEKSALNLTQEEEEVAQNEVNKEAGVEKEKNISTNLPQKYTVQSQDSLWKISLKFYGSGYNWVDIQRENNLKNPNTIKPGLELNIPDVSVRKPIVQAEDGTQQLLSTKQTTPITQNTYVVVKGDNLWNISVRAYQDGFKWVKIAKANNLTNPNIIHPGNTLVIPR